MNHQGHQGHQGHDDDVIHESARIGTNQAPRQSLMPVSCRRTLTMPHVARATSPRFLHCDPRRHGLVAHATHAASAPLPRISSVPIRAPSVAKIEFSFVRIREDSWTTSYVFLVPLVVERQVRTNCGGRHHASIIARTFLPIACSQPGTWRTSHSLPRTNGWAVRFISASSSRLIDWTWSAVMTSSE
jgi:hypothetical protein